MFTGIVQRVGTVAEITRTPTGSRLVIDPGGWGGDLAPGESVAVSGCCLTLALAPDPALAFDVIPETLAKTALGDLTPGDPVNLERSLTLATPLGGHFVQGHVDGVGQVVSVSTEGEHRVRLAPPAGLMRYMTPKGSVALDGVSLTIAALDPGAHGQGGWIEVALIPTTLAETTLSAWTPGRRVNVEADMLAKTVVHHLEHYTNR